MDDFFNIITDGLYNQDYKKGFIIDKYVHYSKESKQQIVNTFRRIGEDESKIDKDIALFNRQELQSLFERNKWISVGVCENKKSLLREYMRWYKSKQFEDWQDCETHLTIDRINYSNLSGELVYQMEYFKSLDELQSKIDVLFDAYGGVDDCELDTAVVCLYLAWYDVDSEEAVMIEKRSVSMVVDQIHLPVSARYIDLDPKPMQFIRDYVQSEGFNVLYKNNLVFRAYKNTAYLLRTTRQAQISENNIRRILSMLSDLYEESGESRRFKYDRIQRSGIYARLIEHEKQYGSLTIKDVDVFEKYFRASYSESINNMAKFYQRFKDYQNYREYYNG